MLKTWCVYQNGVTVSLECEIGVQNVELHLSHFGDLGKYANTAAGRSSTVTAQLPKHPGFANIGAALAIL